MRGLPHCYAFPLLTNIAEFSECALTWIFNPFIVEIAGVWLAGVRYPDNYSDEGVSTNND